MQAGRLIPVVTRFPSETWGLGREPVALRVLSRLQQRLSSHRIAAVAPARVGRDETLDPGRIALDIREMGRTTTRGD